MDGRDDLFSVLGQRVVLVVVLQVDRELIDPERAEFLESLHVVVRGSDDAEPIDDLVRNEVRVCVAGLPVLVVVVPLTVLDVVRQRLGDCTAVAVAVDDVGNVVADHAAEPAKLIACVCVLLIGPVGDVGGCGDAVVDRVGSAAGLGGGCADRSDGPLGDRRIGQLKDEAVSDLSGERQDFRSVGGYPHVTAGVSRPGKAQGGVLVVDGFAVDQALDVDDGLTQLGDGDRLAVGDANRRVAAANADHGPVAVHLVQGREHRGRHRDVPGGGVGHHGTDLDLAGFIKDLAVEHVRLFPQDVGVERPHVVEPVGLSPTRQVDDACGRGSALQDDSDVHNFS